MEARMEAGTDASTWESSPHLCSTIAVERNAEKECRSTSRRQARNHMTVFCRTVVGTTVRRSARTVCFRAEKDGMESMLHAARTTVTERSIEERKERRKRKRSGNNVLDVKSYGRVRTQFTVTTGHRVPGDENEDDEDVESIEVIDDEVGMESNGIRNDVSDNVVRRRSRRRKRRVDEDEESESNMRRKRRRCRINIQQFRLFGRNGRDLQEANGRSVEIGLQPEEKFRRSLRATIWCTLSLQNKWTDAPFLRCSGGERRDQKFICIATLRMKRNIYGGGYLLSVMVALIVQEDSKKVRTLIVKREEKQSSSGRTERGENTWICTCDVRRNGEGQTDSPCWHMKNLRAESVVTAKWESILDCGFMEDHTLYFGDTLTVIETGPNGKYKFDGDSSMYSRTENLNGLVAIQLDDIRQEDLVVRGRRVAKRWSAWLAIDPVERLIVSVVWKPVSTGTEVTRMICSMCRTEMSKKCCHEVACHTECQLNRDADDSSSSDNYSEGEMEINSNVHEDGGNDDAGVLERDGASSGQMVNVDSNGSTVMEFGESSGDVLNTERVAPNVPSSTPGGGGDTEPSVIAINEASGYLPEGPTRSFMFCWTEKWKTRRLIDLIETREERWGALLFSDPDDTKCRGVLEGGTSDEDVKCKRSRGNSENDLPRKCTLVTLNHGTTGIVVLDWVCSECKYQNPYIGFAHGIFPSDAAGVMFTVELLYYWVSEMCSSTRSFRSAYMSTNKLHHAASYSIRFERQLLFKTKAWQKTNRRLGNDAVRRFMQLMDLDSDSIAGQIFTCAKCERRMVASDFKQLSLNPEDNCNAKRLHSVVIDAKVIGLLKDNSSMRDHLDVVSAATGLKVRMITKRLIQNAIVMFIRLVRSCMSKIRNRRSKPVGLEHAECSVNDIGGLQDGYMVRKDHLFMRLSDMRMHGSTAAQKSVTKLNYLMASIRWYIDNTSCLCSNGGAKCLQNPRHDEDASSVLCADVRRSLQKSDGRNEASYTMTCLFRYVPDMELMEAELNGDSETGTAGGSSNAVRDNRSRPGGDISDDSSEDSAVKNDDSCQDGWVVLRYGEYYNVEYIVESMLENVGLCLTEPVTLGFFPYQGWDRMKPVEPKCSSACKPVDNGVDSHSSDSSDEKERDTSDKTDSEDSSTDADKSSTLSGQVHERVKQLAAESIDLHRRAVSVLLELSMCREEGRTAKDWVCRKCTKALGDLLRPASLQNPVLGRFINDISVRGQSYPRCTRQLAFNVGHLYEKRTDGLEEYLRQLSLSMHESAVQYWNRFGRIPVETNPVEGTPIVEEEMELCNAICTNENSAFVFPGRKQFRNGITFEKVDKQACTKNYVKGRTGAVPSFLTVQCACAHPKLLGFVILNRCESISAALSAMITHFPIPPRNIWYDNACNTYDSGMLRIPWLLRWSRLLVDRFHYTGHNCSNMFNGDLQNDVDDDRSVAAEVINSIINKGSSHISYLDGSNVKPFMKVIFAYVNAYAALRDKLGRDDLEDDDVDTLVADMYSCICDGCRNHPTNGSSTTEQYIPEGVHLFTRDNRIVHIMPE